MERMNRPSHAIEIEDHISIDVTDLLSLQLSSSIGEEIRSLPPLSSDCCIYRVPPHLRKLNENAYTPEIVSLGPLHYGKRELVAMEEYKLRYLKAFLNRSQMRLEDCLKVMKEWEARARNCYAETIALSSEEFMRLMVVDSCFIIEVIVRRNFFNMFPLEEENDHLNSLLDRLAVTICRDMLLLENQLPFFVLQSLYNLAFASQQSWFLTLCVNYCRNLVLTSDRTHLIGAANGHIESNFEVRHFVDLLRICEILPSLNSSMPADRGQFVTIRNATKLEEAGMNFKMGSRTNALDVRYAMGVLEIPIVSIYDTIEIQLRNLIALEQCHYPIDQRYITDYIIFMDRLIDSGKDVDLLVRNGIIVNWMADSSAVATLFNNLAMQTALSPRYCYSGISKNLNSYCEIPRHKWKATLKHDYFSTPWRIASTSAAVILLLLTFVQTICSIISLL